MFTKKTCNKDLTQLEGNLPVENLYTCGIAGERFFSEIKEKGRFVGSKCNKCNLIYVPARMFCERCFETLEEYVPVNSTGKVNTFTVCSYDLDENKLANPEIVAFITFDGFHGGIVHKLANIDPKEIKIGMEVQAVFEEKKKRKGSILDVKYFVPCKGNKKK